MSSQITVRAVSPSSIQTATMAVKKLDDTACMYLHAPEFRVPHPLTTAVLGPSFSGAQSGGGRQAGLTFSLKTKGGETTRRTMSLSRVLELYADSRFFIAFFTFTSC